MEKSEVPYICECKEPLMLHIIYSEWHKLIGYASYCRACGYREIHIDFPEVPAYKFRMELKEEKTEVKK